mmetsp:Transcript_7673/g.15955  ORF Transcript_7673/g.15955 Transcript_7673/m.15955 type:complete len:234 (+) Transcript_7673:765-1466(+)
MVLFAARRTGPRERSLDETGICRRRDGDRSHHRPRRSEGHVRHLVHGRSGRTHLADRPGRSVRRGAQLRTRRGHRGGRSGGDLPHGPVTQGRPGPLGHRRPPDLRRRGGPAVDVLGRTRHVDHRNGSQDRQCPGQPQERGVRQAPRRHAQVRRRVGGPGFSDVHGGRRGPERLGRRRERRGLPRGSVALQKGGVLVLLRLVRVNGVLLHHPVLSVAAAGRAVRGQGQYRVHQV